MMENKLWIALCALLLINVGSADHDKAKATASPTSRSPIGTEPTPSAPAADSLPGSSLNQTSHAAASSALNSSDTDIKSNGNATTDGETSFVTHQSKENDTKLVPSFPDNNKTLTDHPTSQPPIPHPESHAPTSHVPSTSTAASPKNITHSAPADTSTTTHPLTTQNISTTLLPDSITSSSQPTHPNTSTLSTSSSQKPPNSQLPTLLPQSNTSQSTRPTAVSEVHSKTTITQPSSTSTQAKAHPDTPSQLNVGGDTMVHKSPTLDPLLAGLVSAFIITAVIITLLLFLKLRRRDNRPEFRRLQDLPMDDMMEDTPLSMYSY